MIHDSTVEVSGTEGAEFFLKVQHAIQNYEGLKRSGTEALSRGDATFEEIMELKGKYDSFDELIKMGNEAENVDNYSQGGTIEPRGSENYFDKIKWGIHEIEVRPHGKGFWGKRIAQNNSRVDAYELKINPKNESYYLPHPNGGYVQFENMFNSTLQDGKLIMHQKSFYNIDAMPDFAKYKVLEEAQRQIEAASAANYKVEWLVSDEYTANRLGKFFNDNNMDIMVRYYPE